MKHRFFSLRLTKLALLGVLGLSTIIGLGACSQQPTGINDTPGTSGSGNKPATTVKTPTATSTSTSNTNTNTGTTTSSNDASFTYRSVDVTITGIDQQKKYSDDDYTSDQKPYILRISIKEKNDSENGSYLFYTDTFRLISTDGTKTAPSKIESYNGVDQGVTRENWVDFQVASKLDVNTLTLRVGLDSESQINVPLKSHPDLSQYQPKTSKPNAKVTYDNLNWTLTQAQSQLSADQTQAKKGYRYIVLSFTVDNPGNDDVYPFPKDNLRLQGASITSEPTNSTLPPSIAGGTNGTTGTVTFLLPDTDKNFTLNFLAQPSSKVEKASLSFQI